MEERCGGQGLQGRLASLFPVHPSSPRPPASPQQPPSCPLPLLPGKNCKSNNRGNRSTSSTRSSAPASHMPPNSKACSPQDREPDPLLAFPPALSSSLPPSFCTQHPRVPGSDLSKLLPILQMAKLRPAVGSALPHECKAELTASLSIPPSWPQRKPSPPAWWGALPPSPARGAAAWAPERT